MLSDAQSFVDHISSMRFENAFNPYSDICARCDQPEAAALRRDNLRKVIEVSLDRGVESLWIARDLGYRGGRRTGLAMTDDKHLSDHAALLGIPSLSRATTGTAVSERTATVIWNALNSIGQPVFLWNVFPLHPHQAEDEMTNRLHTREEREASRPLLEWLIAHLRPKIIVAIGRDSQAALLAMGISHDVIEVRHPSYGGQREFTESIQRLYGYRALQGDLFA